MGMIKVYKYKLLIKDVDLLLFIFVIEKEEMI